MTNESLVTYQLFRLAEMNLLDEYCVECEDSIKKHKEASSCTTSPEDDAKAIAYAFRWDYARKGFGFWFDRNEKTINEYTTEQSRLEELVVL